MTEDTSDTYSETNSYEDEESDTWIGRFLLKRECQGLIYVQDTFIEDRFNLVGLNKMVKNIERAYNVLTDKVSSKNKTEETLLYLLIHQRYILTKQGMERMLEKILQKVYGMCKRMGCEGIPLIPIGLTSTPKLSQAKTYCYNCNNIFEPDEILEEMDGCAFGRTFPHFLILSYKEHFPKKNEGDYVPRIFGFKIFEDKQV